MKFVQYVSSSFLAVLLSACGAQYVRDQAQSQLQAGNYEQALKKLDEGRARFPDDVGLRSSQIDARSSAVTRLLDGASAARRAGNSASAQELLARAAAINPSDDRVSAMQLDVQRDERRKASVEQARELLAKGMRESAMLLVTTALKDSPDDSELLAIQREQELADRREELTTMHLVDSRPVSLDFKDVSVRMVLDVLTRNNGVNFVIDKDVRTDLRTSIYLRDTRVEDALELITSTNQLIYKVLDQGTVLIYPRTAEKMREYQDLVVRAFYLSNADVKQTATMLKTMLKIREPFVDEKLNLIMVRETPETIRLAERLIALQDLAEPEVMLDVAVLEIQRSSLTELGVKYPDSFNLTPIAPEGGFTLGNLRSSLNRNTVNISVPGIGVNLHRDVGDANILANPRIRARNREKAKVLIGDKLPVVTTTGNVTNSGFISESVQYVDVGLKLEVEPDIHLNDDVAIKMGLEVSSLVREVKTAGGSLVYQIGSRTANTVLRLHDGETQLLAGLISNDERMSAARVPGLGDLPVVGRLFASQRDNKQRTEIVLSITPHIVRNIRRPDLNQMEFWSGTENTLRSRPLMPPPSQKPKAVPAGAAGTPGAPSGAGQAMPAVPGAPPPPPNGAAPDAPKFSLALSGPSEVKVGDVFAVHVNLKSDVAIRGLPIELQFPRQTLEVVDAEEGAYFGRDGAQVSKTKALAQAEGRAAMSLLRHPAAGLAGEGTVATFRFKALAAGSAGLTLAASKPISLEPIDAGAPAAVKITVK
jgi:general secretion pathway protein D